MPVLFNCERCHQPIRASRRKGGTMVVCPQCGQVNLVPTVPMGDAAAAVLAEAGFVGGAASFEDISGLIAPLTESPVPPPVYLPPPSSAPMPPLAGGMPPSTSVAERRQGASPASFRVEDAVLVISRRGVYAQGALLLLVSLFFLAAGYLIGRGRVASSVNANAARASADNPVVFEGNLTYAASARQFKADGEAVAIALPFNKKPKPDQKLASRGLRSTDKGDIDTTPAAQALGALGGACARADDDGACQLVVPRPGKYYLLLISKHAKREGGRSIEFDDLRAMSEYFERPADLIGAHRYAWSVRELSDAPPGFAHEF